MKRIVIKFYKKLKPNSHILYIIVGYNKIRSIFLDKLGILNLMRPRLFFINFMKLGFWLNKGAFLQKNVRKYLVKIIK
jgi:hypothetical protein